MRPRARARGGGGGGAASAVGTALAVEYFTVPKILIDLFRNLLHDEAIFKGCIHPSLKKCVNFPLTRSLTKRGMRAVPLTRPVVLGARVRAPRCHISTSTTASSRPEAPPALQTCPSTRQGPPDGSHKPLFPPLSTLATHPVPENPELAFFTLVHYGAVAKLPI